MVGAERDARKGRRGCSDLSSFLNVDMAHSMLWRDRVLIFLQLPELQAVEGPVAKPPLLAGTRCSL